MFEKDHLFQAVCLYNFKFQQAQVLTFKFLNSREGVGADVASDGAPAQEQSSDVFVQINDLEAADANPQTTNDWEILKSIVYGGLLESITSLGVVSSAAGAGAATCKQTALDLNSNHVL